MGESRFLDPAAYPISDPAELPSPRLLVFRAHVERNISRMREHLEGVAPGTGFLHLRPHVKTCKSSWAVRLLLSAGIRKFKASPNELDFLLQVGARDILLAYPPLPDTADRIADALSAALSADRLTPPPQDQLPGGGGGGSSLRLLAQVGVPAHAGFLSRAAQRYGVEIECLIDVDVGMGRTGAPPGRVGEVLAALEASPGLRFSGLHAYDGHNRGTTPEDRARIASEGMELLTQAARKVQRAGEPLPLIVAGGTPAFLPDLAWLIRSGLAREVEVSPGTWVYWDSSYESRMPGMFEPAALIFARVMDHPRDDRLTLDLGHKRWAIDAGPLDLFSAPGLEVLSTSEEHTVLRVVEGGRDRFPIGSHLLLCPRHVCPTVNLWEDFTVVGPRGEVETRSVAVDGRNR